MYSKKNESRKVILQSKAYVKVFQRDFHFKPGEKCIIELLLIIFIIRQNQMKVKYEGLEDSVFEKGF